MARIQSTKRKKTHFIRSAFPDAWDQVSCVLPGRNRRASVAESQSALRRAARQKPQGNPPSVALFSVRYPIYDYYNT